MGIKLTIKIYDEEDAVNLIAMMKAMQGVLLEYVDGEIEDAELS